MINNLLRCLYFSALVGSSSTYVLGDTPQAKCSAEELRGEIARSQAAIESIEIETRSFDYEDELRRAQGLYVFSWVAAKAPHSLLHVKSHGNNLVDWRQDPDMQRAIVTDGRAVRINDLNRTYVELDVSNDDALPGTLSRDFMWAALGVFPLTGRPGPKRPDGGPVTLGEISRDEAFNTVRPRLEQVGGRWCHVLERPGLDVLWIDAEHGCALLAREFLTPETGRVHWRCEASGHTEVAPGIWMPAQLRNIQYTDGQPPQVRRNTVIEVTQCSVNSVSDELFEFTPQPGSLLLNAGDTGSDELKSEQTVAGGIEVLDQIADYAGTAFQNRWESGANVSEESHTPVSRPLLMGVCVGVFVGCMLPISRRRNITSQSQEKS